MSLTGEIYATLGYFFHVRGNYEKAEPYYQKMMKFGSGDPKKVAAYALILMRNGDFNKAVEVFDLARTLDPSPDMRNKIRLNRAMAYYKLGELDKAITALEDIKEKSGPSERLYETLGYFYIATGDLEKALTFNLEALDYEDENHAIRDNLGQTYMMMGDYENARLHCEKALELRPNQVDVLYHMAQIEQHDGNREKARDYWEKAKAAPRTALNDVTDAMLDALAKQIG